MAISPNKDETDFEPTTEDWQLYFLSLQPYPVWIWFATLIKPQAAEGQELHTTARRLFQHLLTYIRCSALAHQHARKKVVAPDGITYLEATWEDYLLADRLLRMNAPRPLQALPDRAQKAFEKLRPRLVIGQTYSKVELGKLLNQPETTVRNWLRRLVDCGLLEIADEKKGSSRLYRLGNGSPDTQELGLVDPKSIDKKVVEQKYQERQLAIHSPAIAGELKGSPVL